MQRNKKLRKSKRTVIATSIAVGALVVGGTAALAAEFFSYHVQSGDTLSEIAQDYGTTVDALAELNNIADPNLIVVDNELLIRRSMMVRRLKVSPESMSSRRAPSRTVTPCRRSPRVLV